MGEETPARPGSETGNILQIKKRLGLETSLEEKRKLECKKKKQESFKRLINIFETKPPDNIPKRKSEKDDSSWIKHDNVRKNTGKIRKDLETPRNALDKKENLESRNQQHSSKFRILVGGKIIGTDNLGEKLPEFEKRKRKERVEDGLDSRGTDPPPFLKKNIERRETIQSTRIRGVNPENTELVKLRQTVHSVRKPSPRSICSNQWKDTNPNNPDDWLNIDRDDMTFDNDRLRKISVAPSQLKKKGHRD